MSCSQVMDLESTKAKEIYSLSKDGLLLVAVLLLLLRAQVRQPAKFANALSRQ